MIITFMSIVPSNDTGIIDGKAVNLNDSLFGQSVCITEDTECSHGANRLIYYRWAKIRIQMGKKEC